MKCLLYHRFFGSSSSYGFRRLDSFHGNIVMRLQNCAPPEFVGQPEDRSGKDSPAQPVPSWGNFSFNLASSIVISSPLTLDIFRVIQTPRLAIASSNQLPGRVYGYTAIARSPEPRLLSSSSVQVRLTIGPDKLVGPFSPYPPIRINCSGLSIGVYARVTVLSSYFQTMKLEFEYLSVTTYKV